MQQLIDDLLMQAQEFLLTGRHELYRRTMDEVRRLKARQAELKGKVQTAENSKTK